MPNSDDVTKPPFSGLPAASSETVRFGLFEFEVLKGRLWRKGAPVSLQQQPMLVLAYLVQKPGGLVTRDELKNQIWPAGTYVEFEFGLNTAINRLRRALGDSASEPRFIETVPKQGYRFIAPVHPAVPESQEVLQAVTEEVISPASADRRRIRITFLATGLSFALALGIAGILHFRYARRLPDPRVYRYTFQLPSGQALESFDLSPPGDQIVYEAVKDGVHRLYRRYLNEEQSRVIGGTDDGRMPFFSPDGEKLAFYTAASLRMADEKGIHSLVAFVPGFTHMDATWAKDGLIYFFADIDGKQGIWQVEASGGPPALLLPVENVGTGMQFGFPNDVLVSRHPRMLYSTDLGPTRRTVRVMDLRTHDTTELIARGVHARVLPTGHILYYSNGSLFAAPFDSETAHFEGSAVEVLKHVAPNGWTRGQFSVSRNGTLAYVTAPELDQRELVWVDQSGKVTPLPMPPADYEQAVVSPDGKRLAIVRRDDQSQWTVWAYGMQGGTWTRLSESDTPAPRVVWSPDSASIVTGSEHDNADFVNLIRVQLPNPQSPQRLTEQPDFGQFPQSWSSQANALLFMEGTHPLTGSDIMVLPLSGARQPHVLVATPGCDRAPSFSPDGRSFTYESDASGRPEIYVQGYDAEHFKTEGVPVKVSKNGGCDPTWSRDGKHIYYLDSNRQDLMDAELRRAPDVIRCTELVRGARPVQTDIWTKSYSVAQDGRFLILRRVAAGAHPSEIHVVVNWFDDLNRLSPQ